MATDRFVKPDATDEEVMEFVRSCGDWTKQFKRIERFECGCIVVFNKNGSEGFQAYNCPKDR